MLSVPACVRVHFSAADERLAAILYRRGVMLVHLQRAIWFGCARKYVALLNAPEQADMLITSLRCCPGTFKDLLAAPGHAYNALSVPGEISTAESGDFSTGGKYSTGVDTKRTLDAEDRFETIEMEETSATNPGAEFASITGKDRGSLDMTKEIWKLSKSEQIVSLIAVALSLVARGLALLPAYSIDDYSFFVTDVKPAQMSQGRLGAVLLREILDRLGALPPSSGLLGNLVLTLMLVWVGILVCRIWRVERLPVLSGLVVLFICLHPYQAEVFTFRGAGLMLAVALGLAFYGISTCFHSRRTQIVAVLLIAAALLTYQVALNYLAIVLLFSLVLHLARLVRPGGPVTADSIQSGRVLRSQLLTFAMAIACSASLTLAIPMLFGVPLQQRTALLKASESGTRAVLALKQLRIMFSLDEPILPIATKWLLALAPLAALAVAAIRSPAGALKALSSRQYLPFVLAIAGGLPASLGVVLVLQEWWPVPRVCAHVSIFWAGMFALVFPAVPPLSQRLMLFLSGFIVLSFIGTNNHIFLDQVRVNLRDRAKAIRIISRLEALPDFTPVLSVVVSGGQWGYYSPIRTTQGDMNISALYAEWSKLALLNEVSGYNLQPSPPAFVEKAKGYCLTAPKWPSPLAVIRLDSFAVVCLAN